MLVVYNNLVDGSGVTFTHTTEVAAFPAENVQILQPSEFFRTTVLNPGYILSNDVSGAARVVALIATNATAHTNICEQSNELDTTWTTTNLAVAQNTSNGGVPGASYSWDLTDNATSGNHSLTIVTSGNAPGNLFTDYDSLTWTASAYVEDDGGPLDCRLRMASGPTHYVECSFDLGAGTAGAPTETGSIWGTPTASITPIAAKIGTGTWYRVSVTAAIEASTTDDPKPTLFLESGGNISYSGSSDKIRAQALMVENAISAGTWVPNTTDTASFWSILETTSSAELMGYAPCVTSPITDGSPVHLIAAITEAGVNDVRVNIYDSNNTDSQLDIGRMIAGPAIEISGNLVGFTPDIEEVGGEARTRGGQRYRGEHPRTGVHEFVLEYLTRDQAYGEVMQMYRTLGRSTPGLFIADETETDYLDEFSIYGFLDGGHPIPRQMGQFWQTRFRVVEVT